jgi:hypothetical protein
MMIMAMMMEIIIIRPVISKLAHLLIERPAHFPINFLSCLFLFKSLVRAFLFPLKITLSFFEKNFFHCIVISNSVLITMRTNFFKFVQI